MIKQKWNPTKGDVIRVLREEEPYFAVGDIGTLESQDNNGDWWARFSLKHNNSVFRDGHWCVGPYNPTKPPRFERVGAEEMEGLMERKKSHSKPYSNRYDEFKRLVKDKKRFAVLRHHLAATVEEPANMRLICRAPYTMVQFTFKKITAIGFAKARPGEKGNEYDVSLGQSIALARAMDDWSLQATAQRL